MALTDNLISYYKLDGNSTDSLGVNNGTDTNVSYVVGKIGNCGSFNGATSRIQVADSASLSLTGAYTIDLWVNITSLPTSGNIVSLINKYDQGANSGGYDISLYNNAGTQQVGMVNASGASSGGGYANYTFTTGTWVYVTVTYDGTNSKMYVNGALVATIANTLNPADNTKLLNIGNFGYYTPSAGELGRYFNGLIDEIGIWSRVLSGSEVTQLYNGGAGLTYPFITSIFTTKIIMY